MTPQRAGSPDLPLHGGRVPGWLAERMARLGAVIGEAIVHYYGHDELFAPACRSVLVPILPCRDGNGWAFLGYHDGARQDEIVNLTDRRAAVSRRAQIEILAGFGPDGIARELSTLERAAATAHRRCRISTSPVATIYRWGYFHAATVRQFSGCG